ncbi:MAG: phosphatase PAP2 family protein [Candidatus Micrarchaeia archaeon]
MDGITALAFSLQDPILRQIDLLIGNDAVFFAILLILVLAGERKNDKRAKILLSIILAVGAGYAIKHAVAEHRPCYGADWCPDDYSFPSLHAVAAFTLMCGFITRKSFPLFFLFAVFVSFTRMNLGVHYFMDIAGALPVAIVSYYVTHILAERWGGPGHG